MDLLCGCLLSGNKIINKHFEVDFSDNSELILMKLSAFLEFADVISASEFCPQRIKSDSLSMPLRKWDRRRSLIMITMKVDVKFMF